MARTIGRRGGSRRSVIDRPAGTLSGQPTRAPAAAPARKPKKSVIPTREQREAALFAKQAAAQTSLGMETGQASSVQNLMAQDGVGGVPALQSTREWALPFGGTPSGAVGANGAFGAGVTDAWSSPEGMARLPGMNVGQMSEFDPHIDPATVISIPKLISMMGIVVGIGGGITAALSKTAVSKLAKIGFGGTVTSTGVYTAGTAGTIATNTATQKTTAKMLRGVGLSGAGVGMFMGAVGSYPFAGFIKEEALQTLGFASTTALKNNDFEGAEKAFALTEHILSAKDSVMSKVPYANVLINLEHFYEAAQIKLEVDRKVLENMRIKIETGETDADMYARNREEKLANEMAITDYYNEQRRLTFDYEQQAYQYARESNRSADRKWMHEQAIFWAAEREKQRLKEAEDRIAIAKFWFEYKKRLLELSEETRPSNLKFGLL